MPSGIRWKGIHPTIRSTLRSNLRYGPEGRRLDAAIRRRQRNGSGGRQETGGRLLASALPYALAIFDLDGTLADSVPWFRRHVNDLADRFGFRRIAEEDIEPLRRAGPREVLARLNVPAWKLPMIVRHTRRLKSEHLDDIALFPGTGAMLRALKEGGLSLALVSSDTLENATRQLGAANAALFSHFACGASLFGKAAKFRRVLRRARADARCAIAIGDEVRDVEAARAVGIACAVVTWGYAAAETLRALKPDLVFEQMEDIARSLVPAA
jgi:phosphoglycolate phosphatase